MPRQKTAVWEHFETIQKNKIHRGYAKCKFCKKLYYGNAPKLRVHLKNCFKCPSEIKRKFMTSVKLETLTSSRSTSDLSGILSASLSNTTEASRIQPKSSSQISSSSSSMKQFCDSISSYEQSFLQILLARSIYGSNAPFSIVENEYFKDFMTRARPSFCLPSRRTVAGSMLDREFKKITQITNEKIKSAEFLTLLSDGWTDINGTPIINLILCTPSPIFYKSMTLGEESHTGENIYSVLKSVIKEVGPNKIQAVVTDNAPNMKAAWELLKEDYPHLITYGCIAHSLNLLAKDFLKLQSVKQIIAQAKDIIKFFNNKHVPKQVFMRIQKDRITNGTTLKSPVDTRWGTYSTTLESIIKNKEILQAACFDVKIYNIVTPSIKKSIISEESFWNRAQSCYDLLEPISKIITSIEGDISTISYIVDHLKFLNSQVTEVATSFSKEEQVKIFRFLKDRTEYINTDLLLAARFLNPKLHYNEDLSHEEFQRVSNFLEEMLRKTELIKGENLELTLTELYVELAEYKLKNEWAKELIWHAAKELSSITWWNVYFPKKVLKQLAVRILILPATSASCERNFKLFSNIKTKKRNRLLVEKTNKLVFIKSNLKYVADKIKLLDEKDVLEINKKVDEMETNNGDNDLTDLSDIEEESNDYDDDEINIEELLDDDSSEENKENNSSEEENEEVEALNVNYGENSEHLLKGDDETEVMNDGCDPEDYSKTIEIISTSEGQLGNSRSLDPSINLQEQDNNCVFTLTHPGKNKIIIFDNLILKK